MRSLITVLVLSSSILHAQYPGGISSNLRAWFDANSGLTMAGGSTNVTQWNDLSGNTFHATQGNGLRRPSLTTAAINYNSAITFDGATNYLDAPDFVPSTATALSAYIVVRQTATSGDALPSIIRGQTSSVGTGGGWGFAAYSLNNDDFGFWVNNYFNNEVDYNTTLAVPTLMTGTWNGTTSNAVECFNNGTTQGTDAFTPGTVGDNGNTYIGSGIGFGTDLCFYGDIAEIAIYNAGHSTTNKNRIETYLGVKYGLTLNHDYINTSGTTVFSITTPYNNQIFGIAREDANNLLQKQSKSVDDTTRIYISTLAASNSANGGSFSSDNSYVIAGANTGRMTGIKTEKPASMFSRLEREWKITNTNFSSTFNMDFKLSTGANLGNISASNLRLLVDADGDFSNATVYAAGGGLSFSYSNPIITVTGISSSMIASGTTSYITIASANAATPLPVELMSFEALLCSSGICVNWKTAAEQDNKEFNVERSADGENWNTIYTIKGAGNSKEISTYSVIDANPLPALSYYRLKQLDYSGKVSYSKNAIVSMPQVKRDVNVFPNPAKDYILVEGLSIDEIRITNSLGSNVTLLVEMSTEPGDMVKINLMDLPGGIYYINSVQLPLAGGIVLSVNH